MGQTFLSASDISGRQECLPHAQNNGPRDQLISRAIFDPQRASIEASSVIKPNLFLGWSSRSSRSSWCWCRSRCRGSRGSHGRSRSGFRVALFAHCATATTARNLVTATAAGRATARATTALMTTTAAAFATAARATAAALATTARRETAAAATTTVREKVAKATTERTTVATTAHFAAAASAAGWGTAAATTTAAVASENESIGGARNGQHGHDQSETIKIHLTHLHLRTRLHARDVRRLANPESRACWTKVGRDVRAG